MQAGWYGVFTQNGGPSGRWKDYIAIPPLKGPSGLRATPKAVYQPYGQGWFIITKANKYPEASFRLADWFYSFEATTDSVFGVEGEDWVRAKEGEIAINGGKALYSVLKVWGGGEENTRHWSQTAPTFRTGAYRLGQTFNPIDPLERTLYEATKSVMEPYGVDNKAVPPVVFTAAQSKSFGELNTTVYSAMDEWFGQFVTGKKNVDKDWDAYIKNLNDSGLPAFLKLYQDALDAKNKKK
jgi:putative aldouronate transport system substrate-binding protein